MSYADFLRTLTPFNYRDIKSKEEIEAYIQKHGDHVKTIMNIADPDGDGTVDYTEFMFFIIFTQLPLEVLEKEFFGATEDGKITEK